jgi:SPP1 family predicted phage head-tail adaptor
MRYDHEIVLIKQTFIEDEIGNQIPIETRKKVLAGIKSVRASEFYSAAATRNNPEIVFQIHQFEYNSEEIVEFEGVRYSVIRTYSSNFKEIELTCERVIGNDQT